MRACARFFTGALFLACSQFGLSAALADPELTRSFGTGDSATGVGIAQGGEDSELEGPQAIYAGDAGELYLLDQLNSRILRFDPRAPGAPPQTLTLPEGLSPTDLVVSNGAIHVWDGRPITLEATGPEAAPTRGLTPTRASGPVDETAVDAFAQMGSVELTDDVVSTLDTTRAVQHAGRARQTIRTHGRGPVTATFVDTDGDSAVRILVGARGGSTFATLQLKVQAKLGAVELLQIDSQGRFFVFAESVPNDVGETAAAFVARYRPDATLEGVYDLPLTSNIGLARRFVTVSPDGDVFFLRTKKGSSDILGVGFRRIKKGQTIVAFNTEPAPQLSGFGSVRPANALVRPLTRRQVLETGAAFANVKWRVTSTIYGSDPDTQCSGFSRIRRPGYLRGKVNQEVTGIPYCWGCFGNLHKIGESFRRGLLAGNVCTRNKPRRDVAGVDCSAFVSAAWGLSSHFTTMAIPAIARQLPSAWDLLPGDALNKPGSHVMLFVRFTPDKKAEVLESSTGGCNGKVCRNVYPIGSLLARGYRPVRYRGLANSTAEVAVPSRPH